MPRNPVAATTRPVVNRNISTTAGLSVDEVDLLLGQADERAVAAAARPTSTRRARHLAALRDRALLRLLADLGLRIGEALALDVDSESSNAGRRTVRYTRRRRAAHRPRTMVRP